MIRIYTESLLCKCMHFIVIHANMISIGRRKTKQLMNTFVTQSHTRTHTLQVKLLLLTVRFNTHYLIISGNIDILPDYANKL